MLIFGIFYSSWTGPYDVQQYDCRIVDNTTCCNDNFNCMTCYDLNLWINYIANNQDSGFMQTISNLDENELISNENKYNTYIY